MPAKIMPAAAPQPSYMNPVRGGADAAGPTKKQQTSDLTVCISLASLFDFEKTGYVSQENWAKGMTTLMLEDWGNDPKMWQRLLEIHGSRDTKIQGLDVQRLTDVVPIDPRVAVLLNAIVNGLVGMRDFVGRSLRKETREADLKKNRALLNIRRKIMEPVLHAWRGFVLQNKKKFKVSVMHARYHMHFKALRQWRNAVEELRAEGADRRKFERKLKRIRGAAMRMRSGQLTGAWNTWHSQYAQMVRLRKVARRMQSRGVSMAFNSWVARRDENNFLRRWARTRAPTPAPSPRALSFFQLVVAVLTTCERPVLILSARAQLSLRRVARDRGLLLSDVRPRRARACQALPRGVTRAAARPALSLRSPTARRPLAAVPRCRSQHFEACAQPRPEQGMEWVARLLDGPGGGCEEVARTGGRRAPVADAWGVDGAQPVVRALPCATHRTCPHTRALAPVASLSLVTPGVTLLSYLPKPPHAIARRRVHLPVRAFLLTSDACARGSHAGQACGASGSASRA